MSTSPNDIISLKGSEKITVLTAYDYTMALLFDRAGVDILLVGDSAAMVMMGHTSTQKISMTEMSVFVSSVAASKPNALVVADMPFMSYQNINEGLDNASRLVDAGAQAVKLEGGAEMAGQIEKLVASDIPVMGHIGFLPQTDSSTGSKRRGMDSDSQEKLINDAKSLQDAGAFSLVLEMVSRQAAKAITESVKIPTIGIGSGADCDGQVLVAQDFLGMYERIKPTFAKRYRNLAKEITDAANEFKRDVRSGTFPSKEHTFAVGDI